jgi:ATP-binding cassette subfamily C protein CydD
MPRRRFALLEIPRRTLALAVTFSLLGTAIVIVQMALIARVTGEVFLHHRRLQDVGASLALLAALAVVQACAVFGREVAAQSAAVRSKAALRARLFAQLLRLGPSYLRGERTGSLLATATEGIERLDPYVGRYLPHVVVSVIAPLLVGAAVWSQDWISGVVLLATAPLLPVLMILVGSYAESHIQVQWTALARMHAHMLDALQGLTTLISFGRVPMERARLQRVGRDYRDKTLQTLRYAFLSSLVLEFLTAGAIALVAVTLGLRLLSGSISFERAFFILLLTPEFYRPLRELGLHRHAAMEGAAAAAQVQEILVQREPIQAGRSSQARIDAHPPTISFESVRYTYPGSERPALTGVDLMLPAGVRTALVGRSGSGKTTLVNLLLRYQDPDAGRIMVGETPLQALTVESWRSQVAAVPQRPYLFAGSVRDNICLGKPQASHEEIERAAGQAGALEFIERLPLGYDTPVGERGARLSGGEMQRIAIARAFLKDAPILVLDEPTSSLDPLSESLIRSALARLMQRRTVLIVAHRLNTVYTAEQIVVLDGGRVAESGTHASLLARQGLYSALLSARSKVAV